MDKNLLKGIVDLLIEHTIKNHKKLSFLYRVAILIILYPLKLYIKIIPENSAKWFLDVTGLRDNFNVVCRKAVFLKVNKNEK